MPPFRLFSRVWTSTTARSRFCGREDSGRKNIGSESLETEVSSFRNALILGQKYGLIRAVNVEDLWQETLPQNVPATNEEPVQTGRRRNAAKRRANPENGRTCRVLTNVFAHRSRTSTCLTKAVILKLLNVWDHTHVSSTVWKHQLRCVGSGRWKKSS